MGRYLIAGWAGSGKTTIASALQARGLPALDSDEVPGLSDWRNRTTGQVVTIDYAKPIDFEHIGWMWHNAVFEDMMRQHPTLYLCGNTSYLHHFIPSFDIFFALQVSEATQRHRLLTRTDSTYGREPSVLERTIAAQQRFIAEAAAAGAHILDAEQPIETIADEIIATTRKFEDAQR